MKFKVGDKVRINGCPGVYTIKKTFTLVGGSPGYDLEGITYRWFDEEELRPARKERSFYPTYEAEKKLIEERAEYYKQFLNIDVVAYGLHDSKTKGRVILKLKDGRKAEVSKADDDVFNADEAILYAYKKAAYVIDSTYRYRYSPYDALNTLITTTTV